MRPHPDDLVVRWLDAQPTESLWTTAITVFEVRVGIELLEKGRRRRELEESFAAVLTEDFAGRVLAFDLSAADSAGTIAAERRRKGRTVDVRDVQIAGIAAARGATVATRNVRDFDGFGVRVVNPWSDT